MFEISKEMTIEMGHRLPNHGGKCKSLHGHSYKIELFCANQHLQSYGSQEGMVEDYKALKDCMTAVDIIFDHALVLCIDDPMLFTLVPGTQQDIKDFTCKLKTTSDVFSTFAGVCGTRLVVVRHPPTAEVLGVVWLSMMRRVFDDVTKDRPSSITKIIVHETATSSAVIDMYLLDFSNYSLDYKDGRRPS